MSERPRQYPPQVSDGEDDTEEEEEEETQKPAIKELFKPSEEPVSWALDGKLTLIDSGNWGGYSTKPKYEKVDGIDAVCLTATGEKKGEYGWYGLAWQHDVPAENFIDISGYKYLILTVKDEFGENKSLKEAEFKIKDNKPTPANGKEVDGKDWIKISGRDEKGWRTVTASLKEFADGGVDLTSVMCINFAGWQDNPDKDGKLYISKVTLSQEAPAVSEDTTPDDDDEPPAGQEPGEEGEDEGDGDDEEQSTDPGASREDEDDGE